MQLKATKLAAILSRLRLAPLALFAALGLALAAPQTAQAVTYYKFTVLGVKANPTGSNKSAVDQQFAISELALYDANGNRLNSGLSYVTAENLLEGGKCFANVDNANSGKLFNGTMSGSEKWWSSTVTTISGANPKYSVIMCLSSDEPVASYNLATADAVTSGYDNRVVTSWKLEKSSDGTNWTTVDVRGYVDTAAPIPTGNYAWYNGGNRFPVQVVTSPNYTEVEYIDSEIFDPGQGPALRIIGFHLQRTDKVETKVRFNQIVPGGSGADNHTIFCNRDQGAANTYTAFVIGDKLRYDRNVSGTATGTMTSGTDYVIVANNYTLTATPSSGSAITAQNTNTLSSDPSSDLILYSHSAFSETDASWDSPQTKTDSSMSRMRMYYFKVTDSSYNVRLDLIPAVVGGDYGMYDRVSGKFYKSATFYPFAGAPVSAIPSVSTLTVTLSADSATYTGSSVEPTITVKDGNTTLVSGVLASAVAGQNKGFSAAWSGTVKNAGTYTLTLTGDGSTYSGTADKGTFTVNKKMAATPVAVVTTYTGSTQDAPIKDASGNNLKGSIWDYASTGSGAQQSGKGEHTVKVQLHDANNYTYTDGATTTTFKWTITDVKCTCSTYSTWTAGENNILRDKLATVTGYGVGNESTAGVAVLTDGANPIPPENDQRTELKGSGTTTFTWDLGGQATVSELRVFVGVPSNPWGHANINITKLEYYDMTAGWKELKFSQSMPYYSTNQKQVQAVITRTTGNLFENATQLRITMSAPIYIDTSAYYSSLTEIEAIGEVHASPIPEANLPRLEPQRTFKYNGNPQSVSLSDNTYVQIVSGDGTGTATATAAGVYYVWVQPKAGYVWPDDESSAPRKYEWGILPSGYTEPFGADRSFLKTLENSPYRVAASALPPGITGGDIILRFPNPGGDSHDFVHVYTNTAATGFVFENKSGMARSGRALLVGGGGGGGQGSGNYNVHDAGGGGGGGAVRSVDLIQFDGAYAINVGAGGSGKNNGADSVLVLSGNVSYGALGGGAGANGGATTSDAAQGKSGGSGGGGAANRTAGIFGVGGAGSSYGYAGGTAGTSGNLSYGAGGGGAGSTGNAGSRGNAKGGFGAVSDIIGFISSYGMHCFGGGGSGGAMGDGNGGFGNGTNIGGGGYANAPNTISVDGLTCLPGVNGLGGGGAGQAMGTGNQVKGPARGGDGIVIVRYTDTVQTRKIKTVQIPVIQTTYVFNYGRYDVLLASGEKLVDTADYTVSGDLGGAYIQDYTVTLTLRDPDNMQWSNGQTQPQNLTWSIVHDQFDDDRSFFKVLATNHNRIATAPLGLTADIVLRSERIRDNTRYYRYELVYKNNASITFNTAVNNADVLLVGGGGAGGSGVTADLAQGGGGGGGGGVNYVKGGVSFADNQPYSLTVGKGGQSASANGEDSMIDTMSGLLTAGGGGGGGANGVNGKTSELGSGGGGGGVGSGDAKSGGSGGTQGKAGGSGCNNGYSGGGGGGGAAENGHDASASQEYHEGRGGAGLVVGIITGLEGQAFGGGGAGGWGAASGSKEMSGGVGGGGSSWPRKSGTNQKGVDGLGGGGAGGSSGSESATGRRGGDGIIVIAFEIEAGTLIDKPTLTTDRITYSGNEIVATDYLSSFAHMTATGTDRATNVGDYQFAVTPASGYEWSDNSGTVAVPFEWSIAAKPIQGNITVPAIPAQTYTGSAITPTLTVTDAELGRTLVKGTDYTVEYFANINIGTATIKLTGTGNYTATANTTFQIVANPNEVSYYVTPEATDEGAGTGWDAPTSLKTAFERASALTDNAKPCAIYMKAGTYTVPSTPWVLSSGIQTMRIVGGYTGIGLARGTERTVLDGDGARQLLSFKVKDEKSQWKREVRFAYVDFENAVDAIIVSHTGSGAPWSRLAFEECRFIGNKTETASRGAILTVGNYSVLPVFLRCEIRGNYATVANSYVLDGGIRGYRYISTAFVGNSGVSAPLFKLGSSNNNGLFVDQCTFAYNAISGALPADKALVIGGDCFGVNWTSVSNTICACNSDANGSTGHLVIGWNGAATYDYVLLGEGDTCQERIGDIGLDTIKNGDPLFAAGTLTPTFGGTAGVATWKNAAGKTVDPVDIDVHLKSVMGRWNGSDWVNDSVTSPAIDAGDPASDYAAEPAPNGGRVNLGAYGNTAEASKTLLGATVSDASGYSAVKLLDNGETVIVFSNPDNACSFTVAEGGLARVLVVGGGGGGGTSYLDNLRTGGGGAGGLVESLSVSLRPGTYDVTVGAGGARDTNGGDSALRLLGVDILAAIGGGAGYGWSQGSGFDGGSGGGGSWTGKGGTGVSGQGHNGGSGNYDTCGGGGGGAGSAGHGGAEEASVRGLGGEGVLSDITGEPSWYAAGGSACGSTVRQNGIGGAGGGGSVGGAGADGTGSGGGAGSVGGRGGNGIVVVHLYSAWTPQFNVTLDPNGGTGGKTSVTATYGEDMPTLDEGDLPTRTGYDFAGYSREGWEVTKMTGEESDILTEGTKVYAYSACDAITLNGVAFTATLQAGTTSGSVTFSPGMACADGGSGNAGKGDATAYGKLMKNKVRNGSEVASLSVTLGGLTENHAYLVQLICHEGNVANARGLSVDGHAYNCCQNGEDASQYGRSFVRCFKATSGSYSFTLGRLGDYLQINALQVREIGGEDDSLLYYNDDGTSAKPWDILGDATLYAQWEVNTRHIERPTQGTASWTYDGQDHRPAFAETDGYTVAYSADAPWKNAGTYTVTFTLKDNCEWADGTDVTSPIEFTYTITQREVTLSWGSTSLTYNRTAQAPTCTAVSLVSGDSCTVTVTGQKTNVGTGYTATATGLSNSNYKLPPAKTTTFSIAKKALTVEGLKATDRPYDGTTTVAITGGTLVGVIAGDTVTCEMPRSGTIADANVGTGKPVTYPALTLGESSAGNYSVTSPSLTVNITQATITGVTLTSASVTYDGQPHQPQVASVTANGKTFNSASTGWDVSYSRNDYTSVGTITVTATGKANLTGSASTTFTIEGPTVTLNKCGGEDGTDSVEATPGSDMPTIVPPFRNGYSFKGYFTQAEGAGDQYYNADGTSARTYPASDFPTTLYANWEFVKTYYLAGKDSGSGLLPSFDETPNNASVPTNGWAETSGGNSVRHTVAAGHDYVAGYLLDMDKSKGAGQSFKGDTLTLSNWLYIYSDVTIQNLISKNATVCLNVDNASAKLSGEVEIAASKSLTFVVCRANRHLEVNSKITGDSTTTLQVRGQNMNDTGLVYTFSGDASEFEGQLYHNTTSGSEFKAPIDMLFTGSFGGRVKGLPEKATNVVFNYDGLPETRTTKGLVMSCASQADVQSVQTNITFYSSSANFSAADFPLMTFPAGTTVTPADFTVYHAATVDGEKTAFTNLGKIVNSDNTITLVANVHMIAKPTAVTGLIYNGSAQKGVLDGEGYTLTDDTGTDATSYTATATLKSGYVWEDGTTAAASVPWSIAKATNAWTTEPKLSATSYPANRPAVLTWGVATFGTATATLDGSSFAQGSALPVTSGNHTLVFTVAGTSNYTELSETIDFTVTEALYDLHAISGTGPVIKDVPSSWLVAAFPTVEETQEAYQAEFLKVNASGVKAWQAYVLGFEGGQVATAKIAEETAQNADPKTVTIQLKDLPTLREGTGCTVKYSLYAATSTEDLMNDRGTVVTNDTDIKNVKVYDKWHESTFEAPLDDLTDDAPVNYYQIKVHFTFGGGDEPKPFDREGYVQVTFNSTASHDLNYLSLEFRDEDMNYVTHDDIVTKGENVIHYYAAMDGFNAGNNVAYNTVYVAPPGTVVGNTLVSYTPSPSSGGVATASYENMTLKAVNAETAMVECDKIWNEITNGDTSLWNGLTKTFISDRKTATEWTRGLTKLQAALQPNSTTQCRILVLGDSLSADFYYGCINAMIETTYKTTNVSITCQQNNNHGCYNYYHDLYYKDTNGSGTGYQPDVDPGTENNCEKLRDIDFNHFDLVILAGTSQLRQCGRDPGLTGIEKVVQYIHRSDSTKGNPDCDVVLISPLLSVDSRIDYYALNEGGSDFCYLDSLKSDFYYWESPRTFAHVNQSVSPYDKWDYTKDPWMSRDYNRDSDGLAKTRSKCTTLGIAYWDLTQLCYQYLYQSGKPFAYFNRDAQHSNRYGKQFAARVVFEVIKMICPPQS